MATPVEAEVRLHGRRIGELRHDRGGAAFLYEDDLSSPTHDVLGQIFEDNPQAPRRTRVGVPAWFANLLPEGALRRQIIRELGGGNIGDFTLLLRLGEHLPGAVSVHADTEPVDDVGSEETAMVAAEPHLRFSLAGFQLKYSVRSDRLTVPGRDADRWWIAKLPDQAFRDLPVNEYLTMRWLAASGFEVPPIALTSSESVDGIPAGIAPGSELVYLVERFDRTATSRVHVEDFAQVADVAPMFKYSESGVTYDSIAAVLLRLTGEGSYLEYVERLAAMLVVGNTDAHLKNWALIYPDRRSPSLSPVYDFHSLTVYSRFRRAPLALSLNGEKLPSAIGLDDFRQLAVRVGADPERTVEAATGAVHRLRHSWEKHVADEAADRFEALAAHYATRLDTLPICTTA